MLLNIVRSRYLEVPVFLTVSSVLTQYVYNASVGVSGALNLGFDGSDTAGGHANLGYSETPTITYLPIEGQEFAAQMLSNIPSEILFAAAQAGWSFDILMRIGIQRIGVVENMSFKEISSRGKNKSKTWYANEIKKLKHFKRMIELIFILNDREVIEVQQIEEEGKKESYLIIAEEVPEDLHQLLGEMREILGLSNRNRYRITDRVTNISDDEITVKTRSIMAMMDFMARGVEVPLEHLKEGRVIDYGLQNSKNEVAKDLIPFKMRSSKKRPEDVFAAMRYGDFWYYVDHADITSKRALNLIIELFRLQAPTPAGAAPILTLPTGR